MTRCGSAGENTLFVSQVIIVIVGITEDTNVYASSSAQASNLHTYAAGLNTFAICLINDTGATLLALDFSPPDFYP